MCPDLTEAATAEKGLADLRERLGAGLAARVGVWANQIRKTFNRARTYHVDNLKFRWRLGNTEEHCADCLALHGQVKTAAEWRAAGIQPQSPDLECGGWNCDCDLVSAVSV